jgi:ABC-type bacteriocin/lantibiotic exporter with double-glycine peptidase domain
MSPFETAAGGSQANPVHDQIRRLQLELQEEGGQEKADVSRYGACLAPFLSALGWRGEARHLFEALPHFDDVDSIDELRAVLARLNFDTKPQPVRLHQLTAEMLPCLFVHSDGRLVVLKNRGDEGFEVFDPADNNVHRIAADHSRGTAYLTAEIDAENEQQAMATYGWMAVLVGRFRRVAAVLLAMTFVINLFALAVPIFIMNVYDKVIGTGSTEVLLYFTVGVLIVIGTDLGLRAIRTRTLAYLGARCETLISGATFEQILHLPVAMTERAAIGSQLARIKQFENIREVFTGTLASAALDIPFMLVFIAAVIIFGGAVAWIPLGLIAVFAIMACVSIPLTKHHVTRTGEMRSRMQNFLIEMTAKRRAIDAAGAADVWLERYKALSGEAIARQLASQHLANVVQHLTQMLIMVAGVATLGVGAIRVMDDQMTMGALIAVMALVWRVLAPIQALFLGLNRLSQVIQSLRQVNQLMRLPVERQPGELPSFYRWFAGHLKLVKVGFRYTPRAEPALLGVSLDIPQGQLVAVTGSSGSGKSTLLKVITGLYAHQAGAVQIDGLDLRQLDPGELRHAMSYVPQSATFFHGTVDQNLRLAEPTATDDDIEAALADAGLDDLALALPEGRQTRLTNEFRHAMPDGLKQRLMLARAWVKDAAVYLLDEPAKNLDGAGDQALVAKLEQLRGRATVIMVTHRPSHMRIADRVVYIDQGVVVHDGKPEHVMPLISSAAA